MSHHLGSLGLKKKYCLQTQHPGLWSNKLHREDLGPNPLENQKNDTLWWLWEENNTRKTKHSLTAKGGWSLIWFCCCLILSSLFSALLIFVIAPKMIYKLEVLPMTGQNQSHGGHFLPSPFPTLLSSTSALGTETPWASVRLGGTRTCVMLCNHWVQRGRDTPADSKHCKFKTFF